MNDSEEIVVFLKKELLLDNYGTIAGLLPFVKRRKILTYGGEVCQIYV